MEGIIDNIQIRIRAHAPQDVESKECRTLDEAINFLYSLKR